MSLPFILDITIGLIFIYLILSLLAAEIQEMITTVLQWRAVHLKKSIEILVAGDAENSDEDTVISFVNDLYNHPLIKSVNQEAKGFLTNLPRHLVWFLSSLTVKLSLFGKKRNHSIFGYTQQDDHTDSQIIKHSGPSYIPAESFAITVMETLGIPVLVKKLTESRLINFKDQQLHQIQTILLNFHNQVNNIDDHITKFSVTIYQDFTEIIEQNFAKILDDFQKDKADLTTSMNRMAQTLDRYIEIFQEDMPDDFFAGKALRKLRFMKEDVFNNIERTIDLQGLKPNVHEVVQLINIGSDIHQGLLNEFQDKNSEAYKTFQYFSDKLQVFAKKLPPSVVSNMATLAKRAQAKAKSTEEGIYILQQEIEQTFDQSMERAAGVYKRNAKGVALLIGFTIAIIANADAFHIVSRLSKDSAIRIAIVNNAGEILDSNNVDKSRKLEVIKQETDRLLAEVSLPIGWNAVNLEQQIDWHPNKKYHFYIWKLLTMICGWFVSGVAISMGAPFWFDLLGKFVHVRNAGKPPKPSKK
jgi:phosphohistidine swiveling domain-containing protein